MISLRGLFVAAAIVAVFLCAVGASAHSWYPPECCSDQDCFPLKSEDVKATPDGYQLATGEFVPTAKAKPGRDDQYHVCKNTAGVICFFTPSFGS